MEVSEEVNEVKREKGVLHTNGKDGKRLTEGTF